jgi:homoserine/homoserine lactone efflux protein
MDFSTWLAFFAACWAISISPGAGAVAAMTAGLQHGFRRGYITTAGLILGIWTQMLVVGVGLGAVVATSALAFQAIKWAGVAYLVYLGVQQWRAPARALVSDAAPHMSPLDIRGMILRGWAINAVNPKGTVFLLAVLPQFLDLSAPLWPQYLVMALSLGFTDLVVMGGYTALAARVLRTLRSEAHVRATQRLFGALFILAGALLAVFKRGD